jgi:hypothetical protein
MAVSENHSPLIFCIPCQTFKEPHEFHPSTIKSNRRICRRCLCCKCRKNKQRAAARPAYRILLAARRTEERLGILFPACDLSEKIVAGMLTEAGISTEFGDAEVVSKNWRLVRKDVTNQLDKSNCVLMSSQEALVHLRPAYKQRAKKQPDPKDATASVSQVPDVAN